MKIHSETPLLESLILSKGRRGRVWLKMEALQPTGSFKARGIGFACQHYITKGATSLVSSSGGNAGLAVAYAGRRLNVPVTVVVPETTKQRAIDLIEIEKATVIVKGENWNQAHQHALSISGDKSAYIHPYDDPFIWDGHATVIDEVHASGMKPDCIVLSVGGGGLLCGVVNGLLKNQWGDIPILAVETQGADSFHKALKENKYTGIDAITSIATSLGATIVAKQAFEYSRQHNITSHVVSDAEAVQACIDFLQDHRVMVEPACGASLAAVYNGCDFLTDKQNVLVIVCGGVGVTQEQLKAWEKQLL